MPTESCKICGQTFEISDDDLAYYEKIGVPTPKLCPKDKRRNQLIPFPY